MSYSIFNKKITNTLTQPMFFGDTVNVARFDKQKFEMFEKLTEKQLSFFWRPEAIDVTKDKMDFAKLLPNEKHIFLCTECFKEFFSFLTRFLNSKVFINY